MNGFVNRYRELGLSVDRSLRNYSTHEDEQKAFESMQESLILLGEKLLSQEDGACADIADEIHWVSPVRNKLIVNSSPEMAVIDGGIDIPPSPDRWTAWDFGGIGVEEIMSYKKSIDRWLENPAFYFADQDRLDSVALCYADDEKITETKAFIQAVSESKALDAHIVDSNDPSERIGF